MFCFQFATLLGDGAEELPLLEVAVLVEVAQPLLSTEPVHGHVFYPT